MMKFQDRPSRYIGSPESWIEFFYLWGKKRIELNLDDDDAYMQVLQRWGKKRSDLDLEGREQNFQETVLDHEMISERENRIKQTEKRLKLALPKSYRDFIIATDSRVPAWGMFDSSLGGWGSVDGMLAIEKIDLLKNTNPDLVSTFSPENLGYVVHDADYYQYNYTQDGACTIRGEYLKDLVQIKYTGEELREILINPLVTTKDKEWEAWDFETKQGYVWRFPSFAEMVFFFYMSDVTDSDHAFDVAWDGAKVDPYGIGKLIVS